MGSGERESCGYLCVDVVESFEHNEKIVVASLMRSVLLAGFDNVFKVLRERAADITRSTRIVETRFHKLNEFYANFVRVLEGDSIEPRKNIGEEMFYVSNYW